MKRAEAFARHLKIAAVPPGYFFTERRWQELVKELNDQHLPIPPRPEGAPPAPTAADTHYRPDDHRFGTVGVAALDSHGNVAAGTSTGGLIALSLLDGRQLWRVAPRAPDWDWVAVSP